MTSREIMTKIVGTDNIQKLLNDIEIANERGAEIDRKAESEVKKISLNLPIIKSLPPYEDCDCDEPNKCLRICHSLIKRCGNVL